jgi:hypothetical protein
MADSLFLPRIVVGEWTAAITDCAPALNRYGIGARFDGTFVGSTYQAPTQTTTLPTGMIPLRAICEGILKRNYLLSRATHRARHFGISRRSLLMSGMLSSCLTTASFLKL